VDYWKPPDRRSPHMNAKGPRLQLIKLRDPVPKEFSDLMSPLLYSATTRGVIGGPQVLGGPQAPGGPPPAALSAQLAQVQGGLQVPDPQHPAESGGASSSWAGGASSSWAGYRWT